MLSKIISVHPVLRPMVVAQVAEFTASVWLNSEMDISETKLGGALDKVPYHCYLFTLSSIQCQLSVKK